MKILIIGATGMLGHKMYMKLKNDFECVAMARSSFAAVEQFEIFDKNNFVGGVDVSNDGALHEQLNNLNPQVVLNCVGVTTRKIDNNKISQLIKINSYLPHLLDEWCSAHASRLIHFSTDCVFSGKKGAYTEDDLTDARDHYGMSKALGEVSSATSLTIRSSIVGLEIMHKTELFEWLISQRQKQIKGFDQAFYSGVTTNYMCDFVSDVLKNHPKLSGIVHLSSPRISKYELLCKLSEALELDIKVVPQSDYKSDKSLDSTRLFNIIKTSEKPNWNGMIAEIKREFPLYQRWAKNGAKR